MFNLCLTFSYHAAVTAGSVPGGQSSHRAGFAAGRQSAVFTHVTCSKNQQEVCFSVLTPERLLHSSQITESNSSLL